MKIKEILEGISFYKIPELKPDEVIVLSTSTLIEQHQFEVIKGEIAKIIPNKKWVLFTGDDFKMAISENKDEK